MLYNISRFKTKTPIKMKIYKIAKPTSKMSSEELKEAAEAILNSNESNSTINSKLYPIAHEAYNRRDISVFEIISQYLPSIGKSILDLVIHICSLSAIPTTLRMPLGLAIENYLQQSLEP